MINLSVALANSHELDYRLYTVVPKLLGLIDNTTNWYIRFNRSRLKGENGSEETRLALHTLFEVLYTLCRGLAPFTPFLTDSIYKRILPHIPEHMRALDNRSIHFLSFPAVRTELFDGEVERRVDRMQRIIEMGRMSRERRTISLKTPLKSLIVIHNDQGYLDDLKSLSGYITRELNVHELTLTVDEKKYSVEYTVKADWPVLGRKLKKDMAKVKRALPFVSSEEVQAYVRDKFIMVDGIRLEEGDLIVHRGLRDGASPNLETNTDNDALTILDVELYPELAQEGLAREIINRVQKLRKKVGLQPTDDIKMEYRLVNDLDNIGLATVFETQVAAFERVLRRPIEKADDTTSQNLIAEEDQEVQKATFNLRLLRL